MAVSNHADLGDAALLVYAPTMSWNLCEGLDTCESGTHTVYAKYYTSFGVGSTLSKVSDSITLLLPVLSVETTNIESSPNISTSSSSGGLSVGGSGSFGGSQNTNTGSSSSGDTTSQKTISSAELAPTSNAPEEVIVTSVIPTATTVAFSEPALKSLSQARESAVVAKPIVNTVNKSITGGYITFLGKGIPRSKVALFIHSDQVVVYTTDVNENGEWNYKHDQGNVELAPGEHSVFAVTYDPGSKVKSKPSLVQTFVVKRNTAAVILSYVDLPTTLLTLLACIFGAVYIGTRKRKIVK
jgi:hypothetical protein